MTSYAETAAPYRILWSLFTAIEKGHQPMIDATMADTDDDVLLPGWHVVARYDQKLWNPELEGERGVPSPLT